MKKRSKLLDNPPEYGGPLWGAYQYERAKEANRGHNYRYYNEEWWVDMSNVGWEMELMDVTERHEYWTASEYAAQERVKQLRALGNYSRIICGYHQTKQHQKFYTVIYKKK